MVQSQSTLTGCAVTFSGRTSLLQPQGNGSFSRTAVNQSFFYRHKSRRGWGLFFTLSKICDKHYGIFRETIQL